MTAVAALHATSPSLQTLPSPAAATFNIAALNGHLANPSPTRQTVTVSAASSERQAYGQLPRGSRVFPSPLSPRSFTILKEVGDGSFGTVWLADWHARLDLPAGTPPPGPSSRPEYRGKQVVAIKRMKKAFEGGWEECMKLKELKSLQQIPMHPNIIPLYDAFLQPQSKELYFVFECMEGNLYQLTKSRKGRPLASGLIASIFQQMLFGLDHIHANGYFHRDMKPENVLITTTGLADYPPSALYAPPGTPPEKDVTVILKLADFGLARETESRPPYTEYVSTRWYRAPEVLLRSREYSNPVDMWALGTIMVEVITLKPLFPGDTEVDQVLKICDVLGNPSDAYGYDSRGRMRGGGPWARGIKMARDVGFSFPQVAPANLSRIFDTTVVPIQLIDLVADLLRYEPRSRLNTRQCLDHAYFREVAYRFAAPSAYSSYQMSMTPSVSSASVSTPRDLPPSHSNMSQPAKSFQPSDQYHSLPPPGSGSQMSTPSSQPYNTTADGRHPSIVSVASTTGSTGMSAFGVQFMPPSTGATSGYPSPVMHFPENVGERRDSNYPYPSPTPSYATDGQGWSAPPQPPPNAAPMVPPPFGAPPSIRRKNSFSGSIAASTFYDGSIFEGIAPTRAASIMSFPAYGGGGQYFNDGASSINYGGNGDRSPSMYDGRSMFDGASGYRMNVPQPGQPQQQQQQQQQQHNANGRIVMPSGSVAPSIAPSSKSRSWKPFSSAQSEKSTNSTASGSSPPLNQADHFAASNHSLKRSPSNLSTNGPTASESAAPVDAKTAKKQAKEKAKEAEKAKREAMQKAQRERARAVMNKQKQLAEAADPLHANANQSRPVPSVDKGKARSIAGSSAASFVSQTRSPALPHISEYGEAGRLQPPYQDMRYKMRRRDDDESIHSFSSSSTGHSSQRRVSVSSSVATGDTDGSRRGQGGVPYGHGSGAIGHPPYFYGSAPSTGHSSLDSQLVQNMQSLATDENKWHAQQQQQHDGGHMGNGMFQGRLPPISTFTTSEINQKHHSAHPPQSAGVASVASFHSTPSLLPSYGLHGGPPSSHGPPSPRTHMFSSQGPPSPLHQRADAEQEDVTMEGGQ